MYKSLVHALITILLFLPLTHAITGELKTVKLAVDGMTCNMCPVTVKKALRKLDGVTEVDAKYEGKGAGWTRVTFDVDKVNVDDLTLATEEAGYPSRLLP